MEIKQNEFFYCYSPMLFYFLKFDKSLEYICTGKHIVSNKQFWQFKRTPELEKAIDEFKERKLKFFNSEKKS
jgi:hypothetical protein